MTIAIDYLMDRLNCGQRQSLTVKFENHQVAELIVVENMVKRSRVESANGYFLSLTIMVAVV